MAGAYVTLKVTPEDHQALLALLKYLAGKLSDPQFLAVLQSQGRRIPESMSISMVTGPLADQLIGAFS